MDNVGVSIGRCADILTDPDGHIAEQGSAAQLMEAAEAAPDNRAAALLATRKASPQDACDG